MEPRALWVLGKNSTDSTISPVPSLPLPVLFLSLPTVPKLSLNMTEHQNDGEVVETASLGPTQEF